MPKKIFRVEFKTHTYVAAEDAWEAEELAKRILLTKTAVDELEIGNTRVKEEPTLHDVPYPQWDKRPVGGTQTIRETLREATQAEADRLTRVLEGKPSA